MVQPASFPHCHLYFFPCTDVPRSVRATDFPTIDPTPFPRRRGLSPWRRCSLATTPTSPQPCIRSPRSRLSLQELEQPPPPSTSPHPIKSPATSLRSSLRFISVIGSADLAVPGLRWSKMTTTIAWLRHHLPCAGGHEAFG
jgi:hypothetical protein